MRSAVRVVAGFVLCLQAAAAAPPPGKSPVPTDAAVIADALNERFDIERRLDKAKLKDVLHLLEERIGVTIILDTKALSISGDGAENANLLTDLEEREITLPAMKRVRVATVLKAVCDQINAVSLIEADHVRLTSPAAKDHLLGDPASIPSITVAPGADEPSVSRDERVRLSPTVTVAFDQKAVAEAAATLAERGGRPLILSAGALAQANAKVSFALSNVTFETAAVALAEVAGLRVVKQGNVVVLVTAERFKELTPAAPAGQFTVHAGSNGLTLDELLAISKLVGGKPSEGEQIQREIDKLKQERAAAEAILKELAAKIEQYKHEMKKN